MSGYGMIKDLLRNSEAERPKRKRGNRIELASKLREEYFEISSILNKAYSTDGVSNEVIEDLNDILNKMNLTMQLLEE